MALRVNFFKYRRLK
uniref:Uncharacterized protein n=1 Tax=Anguilla anguilla TaxID=7936 RepID=A0A0E9VQ34_ANGAN